MKETPLSKCEHGAYYKDPCEKCDDAGNLRWYKTDTGEACRITDDSYKGLKPFFEKEGWEEYPNK